MLGLRVQAVGFLCTLLYGWGPARALEPVSLEGFQGTWQGEQDGHAVVWRVESTGRLRADGRMADCSISGDTLTVRFDASVVGGSSSGRETAVYRFRANNLNSKAASIFVYGFDLGLRGIWLRRQPPAEPRQAEDAAPPAPGNPGRPKAASPKH